MGQVEVTTRPHQVFHLHNNSRAQQGRQIGRRRQKRVGSGLRLGLGVQLLLFLSLELSPLARHCNYKQNVHSLLFCNSFTFSPPLLEKKSPLTSTVSVVSVASVAPLPKSLVSLFSSSESNVEISKETEVLTSSSSSSLPVAPPFPDTASFNNALNNLAKASASKSKNKNGNENGNSNSNKEGGISSSGINSSTNSLNINQSAAKKLEDLLFECEEWYKSHLRAGYKILQPAEYQQLVDEYDSERNENGNKNGYDGSGDGEISASALPMVITGPVPNMYSFSTVIDAWAKIGISHKATQLLRYMQEQSLAEEDDINVDVYIDKKYQRRPEKRNIEPNTITYNSVINSLCNSIQQGRATSNPDEAEVSQTPIVAQELLNEMKQCVLQKTNVNCTPDTTTYNTVLKVWSRSSRDDCGYYSEKLLDEMWFHHYRYQKFIDGEDDDDDMAGEIDNKNDNNNNACNSNSDSNNNEVSMLLLNVTPDQFTYSTAISALARSSARTNNGPSSSSSSAKKAEKLLEQMEEYRSKGYQHLSPTTYCVNAVLNAWSKIASNSRVNGAAYRAEIILKRMEDMCYAGGRDEFCPNTISYNTVISAYARSREAGSERRAERILRRMDQVNSNRHRVNSGNNNHGVKGTNQQNSCQPDIISYNTVINGWSRSKDAQAPKRAEAILNHMEKQYKKGLSPIQPDVVSYTSCIATWARCRSNIVPDMAHRAQAILDRMDEAYRAGNLSAKPTVLTYNTVCNAWAKSRSDDAASQVLAILEQMETMHKNGEMYVKPDIFTYTTCIDTLAKQGTKDSTEKAMELLNVIEERYNKSFDADIKPNVRTYTSVINAISKSKLGPERAEDLLARIERMAKDTEDKDLNVDVVCFNAVLNAWGWSSEPDKARKANDIYQKMLKLYKSRENIDAKPDLITLNSLLNACAFSNTGDEKESSEAVDIAIEAYEMYQSKAPLYGIPNHLTYGTMLMIFNKLLPLSELRDELMKNVFYHCCEKGHLSGFVVSQLRHGFSGSTLKELFGKAAVSDGSNVVIDKRKVPREWTRFAGGRSRPSRKRRPINEVSKQQVSRSPIT